MSEKKQLNDMDGEKQNNNNSRAGNN